MNKLDDYEFKGEVDVGVKKKMKWTIYANLRWWPVACGCFDSGGW